MAENCFAYFYMTDMAFEGQMLLLEWTGQSDSTKSITLFSHSKIVTDLEGGEGV